MGNHDNPRVATNVGVKNADLMNMVLAFLPGIAVTYNGEEIGMENGKVELDQCQDQSVCGDDEAFDERGRDPERTPFHWDKSENAGFNKGTKPWLPVSEKYLENNLRDQSAPGYQNSHYQLYKRLMQMRQEPALLNDEGFRILKSNDNLLVFVRYAANKSGTTSYAVVLNFGDTEHDVNLAASDGKAIDAGLTEKLRVVMSTDGSSDVLYK